MKNLTLNQKDAVHNRYIGSIRSEHGSPKDQKSFSKKYSKVKMPKFIKPNLNSSAKDPDPDPLDPQGFGFLNPDPRGKILQKKCLFSKPESELIKKRDYKIFLISETSEKILQKNENSALNKKLSKF